MQGFHARLSLMRILDAVSVGSVVPEKRWRRKMDLLHPESTYLFGGAPLFGFDVLRLRHDFPQEVELFARPLVALPG
jgi:hypothetical protein